MQPESPGAHRDGGAYITPFAERPVLQLPRKVYAESRGAHRDTGAYMTHLAEPCEFEYV